jgi:hypothetical protein
MKPDGTFAEQPWQEKCQVGYVGCQQTPDVRITCIVEGASLMSCHSCHKAWQGQVQSVPGFENRCPRCAEWAGWSGAKPAVVREVPEQTLTGPVATALDAAMHAEGLLVDVRQKVLRRLKQDSEWLEAPEISGVYPPALRVVPG